MSSPVDDTVPSPNTEADCVLYGYLDVCPAGFDVYAILVSDHPSTEVSVAFFKESISRPIITVRYLWVESLL